MIRIRFFGPGELNQKGFRAARYTHSTAQHSTAQHSTAQHSTAQHSTAQHSTAQHSTAQHSTRDPRDTVTLARVAQLSVSDTLLSEVCLSAVVPSSGAPLFLLTVLGNFPLLFLLRPTSDMLGYLDKDTWVGEERGQALGEGGGEEGSQTVDPPRTTFGAPNKFCLVSGFQGFRVSGLARSGAPSFCEDCLRLAGRGSVKDTYPPDYPNAIFRWHQARRALIESLAQTSFGEKKSTLSGHQMACANELRITNPRWALF